MNTSTETQLTIEQQKAAQLKQLGKYGKYRAIKFVVHHYVDGINPNGDSQTGLPNVCIHSNRGFITHKSLKHKMRCFMQQNDENVLLTNALNDTGDNICARIGLSLVDLKAAVKAANGDALRARLINEFIDCRLFGFLVGSLGSIGAVQVTDSYSVDEVKTNTFGNTKCITTDANSGDNYGISVTVVVDTLYQFTGTIDMLRAAKVGITERDLDMFMSSLLMFTEGANSATQSPTKHVVKAAVWIGEKNKQSPVTRIINNIKTVQQNDLGSYTLDSTTVPGSCDSYDVFAFDDELVAATDAPQFVQL